MWVFVWDDGEWIVSEQELRETPGRPDQCGTLAAFASAACSARKVLSTCMEEPRAQNPRAVPASYIVRQEAVRPVITQYRGLTDKF
jgi:hypothetical protein